MGSAKRKKQNLLKSKKEKRWAEAKSFLKLHDARTIRGFYARAVKILLDSKHWDATIIPITLVDEHVNAQHMSAQFNTQTAERIKSDEAVIERKVTMSIRKTGNLPVIKKQVTRFTGEMMKLIREFIPPSTPDRVKKMAKFSRYINRRFNSKKG